VADRPSPASLVPLQVHVSHVGATAHVAVAGDLDMATAPRLQSALDAVIERGSTQVVLDLRDVEFLGSSGIAILEGLERQAQTAGFTVTVVRGSLAVQRVLEIAGLPDRMHFVDSPLVERR
jgi:anti-sigma B factor antagonist